MNNHGTAKVGGVTGNAFATFGGQVMPMCNYISPLSRKFVYKNKGDVFYPLRRHVFRQKVRTAAEIKINEVVKAFSQSKLAGKYGVNTLTMTGNAEPDHMGCIIPRDEYEVKKFTSYMTTKADSRDMKEAAQSNFRRVYFMALENSFAGQAENIQYQQARFCTDEEAMAFAWYSFGFAVVIGVTSSIVYWWYKYSHQPEYLEIY